MDKLAELMVVAAAIASAQESGRVAIEGVPDDAIRVHVVDPEGRPIPGARLAYCKAASKWLPEQGSPGLRWSFRRVTTRTDESGTALLVDLDPESWRVAAGAPPERGYHFSEPTRPGSSVTITLPRLPADRLLTGVVLNPHGAPQPGAKVRFAWDDRGRQRVVFGRADLVGRFALVADEPGVTGTIHASVYRNTLRSTAIEPIAAGTTGIELQLGEPRFFTLEVRDQDERVLTDATAQFYWELAGFPFQDYPGPRESLRWELPDVPFYVSVRAEGRWSTRLGPFDPEAVGSTLIIRLSRPHVRGRVTHEGRGVADARVWFRGADTSPGIDLELVRVFVGGGEWGGSATTDSEGRFDMIVHEGPGPASLVAWSPTVGEGVLGPLEIDLADPPDDLEIVIDRAPGAIAGRVLLPPGRNPAEVWLATNAYYHGIDLPRLEDDGSFVVPALPPGPLSLWLRKEHVVACDLTWGLRSTRLDWLEVEPTFDVEVRSGETVELDIDLVAPAACSLEGLLWVDGEPPPSDSAPRRSLYVERAVLDRGHVPYHVSRTDFTPEGEFTLTAAAPGTYRLYLDVPTGAGSTWTLVDRVRLELAARDWELDVPTGALRVLPREDDGRVVPFGGRLRCRGPGDVRVFVGRGETNEKTREVAFPLVPAGKVQLYQDVAGERTILLETEVAAGETTTVRMP